MGLVRRGTFGEMMETSNQPLAMQLSGLLARGPRLIDRFVQAEPTPETMMAFERELSALLREVGRRMMAWTLNRLEPDDDDAPSRVEFEGRLYLPPGPKKDGGPTPSLETSGVGTDCRFLSCG